MTLDEYRDGLFLLFISLFHKILSWSGVKLPRLAENDIFKIKQIDSTFWPGTDG